MNIQHAPFSNGDFFLHGITGDFKGKASGYFDADGKLNDAEQIVGDYVRTIKRNGPIWRYIETFGRIYRA